MPGGSPTGSTWPGTPTRPSTGVRKAEGRENGPLKRTKHLWLGNEAALSGLRLETKRGLTRQRLKTARACRMREVLQDIHMDGRTPAGAWGGLCRLRSWMMRSRPEPMKEPARLIRRRFAEIVACSGHPYANAVLEGCRQRHPEREETGPRLPQHGPLRHHDPPDLRQTRPQSRHRRLTTTRRKTAKGLYFLYVPANIGAGLKREYRLGFLWT